MVLTRRVFAFGALACAAMIRPSFASASSAAVTQGLAFGSTWRLVTAEPVSAAARMRIEDIIARVDAQMSPYRDSSALSRFNAHTDDGWQAMPSALCEVAGQAIEMARFTGGAFDPTVGPVVNRFGFGPIQGGHVQAAGGRFEGISFGVNALKKRDASLTLDLCGIAKGYALDQITQGLRAEGVGDFMFELGGEVRTHGQHPSGRDWRIAIADPARNASGARFVVALAGKAALATSGHDANGLGGPIATSHIIDPQSQRPVAQFARSVSVLADTAMQADGLATALSAMGPQGPVFAQEHGVSALFLLSQASQQSHIMTGHFATHVLA